MTRPDGSHEFRHIDAVDLNHPDANRLQVVHQLSISGNNDRRPDIVLFELKNPYNEQPIAELHP